MALPADAPRRSSRRPKPKQHSSYNVGDVVEISRNNVEGRGRLVYKLSEGPTANPRWLVTFDGQAWKDEELYERSFGKILSKSEEGESSSKSARKGLRTRGGNNSSNSKASSSVKTNNSSSKSSGPSSGEDEEQSGSKKKKAVGFPEGSMMGSEDSSPPSNTGEGGSAEAKVSAREQRSLRRQAMIQEEAVDSLLPEGKKRGRSGAPVTKNNSNGNGKSNKKSRKDEEVVKIPMLTGTLYLYRGLYRRAEFVRRY